MEINGQIKENNYIMDVGMMQTLFQHPEVKKKKKNTAASRMIKLLSRAEKCWTPHIAHCFQSLFTAPPRNELWAIIPPKILTLTAEGGFMAQEDAQMKKESGLRPCKSPHVPLETPEQQPTCWRFALLLSPNPNAKPDHSCKPREMMGCQKGCKQWLAKTRARAKSF